MFCLHYPQNKSSHKIRLNKKKEAGLQLTGLSPEYCIYFYSFLYNQKLTINSEQNYFSKAKIKEKGSTDLPAPQ